MRNILLAVAVLLVGIATFSRLNAHYGWLQDAALRRALSVVAIVSGLVAIALVWYLELTSR
jgi:hypothetical protein